MMDPKELKELKKEIEESTIGYTGYERPISDLGLELRLKEEPITSGGAFAPSIDLRQFLQSITETLQEIDRRLRRVESIEDKLELLEKKLGGREEIIIVKEISFDEAKKMVEEYIAQKKGEVITPLELSDSLQIPYEVAHEIFLQLIEEGKLEIKDVEEY